MVKGDVARRMSLRRDRHKGCRTGHVGKLATEHGQGQPLAMCCGIIFRGRALSEGTDVQGKTGNRGQRRKLLHLVLPFAIVFLRGEDRAPLASDPSALRRRQCRGWPVRWHQLCQHPR